MTTSTQRRRESSCVRRSRAPCPKPRGACRAQCTAHAMACVLLQVCEALRARLGNTTAKAAQPRADTIHTRRGGPAPASSRDITQEEGCGLIAADGMLMAC